MKYYKNPNTGDVFSYETETERQEWGALELGEMTQAEIDVHLNPPADPAQLADAARADRDRRLRDCDWVIIRAQETGAPMPTDWLGYRQSLRDVPDQNKFPFDIHWPTKPM